MGKEGRIIIGGFSFLVPSANWALLNGAGREEEEEREEEEKELLHWGEQRGKVMLSLNQTCSEDQKYVLFGFFYGILGLFSF